MPRPRGRGEAATFSNPAAISIPVSGSASPYPSIVTVFGLSGLITEVEVTLSGFNHSYPDDVCVLLVGPFGQAVELMDGPGDGQAAVGALGAGLPLRDLVLTADYALLIDGMLVNAGALVNGGSIDYVPLGKLGDSYTVYHIETEAHDMILAEGAAAETFIDYVGRQAFDNDAEYVALYGDAAVMREAPLPRVTSARALPAGRRARLFGGLAAERRVWSVRR